jgi:RNA polymerase sigma factor FliA
MEASMDERSRVAWSNADARRALARYESLVRSVARRLLPWAAAGRALDAEDLHAEGYVAVLEALSSYQGYGIGEHAWVRTRIYQRMIDAIRRLDPRSRAEMRVVIKHAAGLSSDDDLDRDRTIAARRVVSIDSSPCGEPLGGHLPDEEGRMADEAAHERRRQAQLLHALTLLPRRQRTALELRLFDGLALKEIGRRMGISEGRVCQLHKRAVAHLSSQLAEAA